MKEWHNEENSSEVKRVMETMALPDKKPHDGDSSETVTPDNSVTPEQKENEAFDMWLERGLHQLFDEVANEPIPEELLKLIEDDRKQ